MGWKVSRLGRKKAWPKRGEAGERGKSNLKINYEGAGMCPCSHASRWKVKLSQKWKICDGKMKEKKENRHKEKKKLLEIWGETPGPCAHLHSIWSGFQMAPLKSKKVTTVGGGFFEGIHVTRKPTVTRSFQSCDKKLQEAHGATILCAPKEASNQSGGETYWGKICLR